MTQSKLDFYLFILLMVAFAVTIGGLVFLDVEVIVAALGSPYLKWYFCSSVVVSYFLIAQICPNEGNGDVVGTLMVSVFMGMFIWPFLLWRYVRK